MIILTCICLAIVLQYRYYARQRLIERQLTTEMIHQTRQNLQSVKNTSKRYLEFESDNR